MGTLKDMNLITLCLSFIFTASYYNNLAFLVLLHQSPIGSDVIRYDYALPIKEERQLFKIII